jgi:hypothetical protein
MHPAATAHIPVDQPLGAFLPYSREAMQPDRCHEYVEFLPVLGVWLLPHKLMEQSHG